VRGLLSHAKGATFDYLLQLLKRENLYSIESALVHMADFGIPQKRVRLFIIGTLKVLNINVFPISKSQNTKKKILKDILLDVPFSKGSQYSLNKIELFKKIPEGGC